MFKNISNYLYFFWVFVFFVFLDDDVRDDVRDDVGDDDHSANYTIRCMEFD